MIFASKGCDLNKFCNTYNSLFDAYCHNNVGFSIRPYYQKIFFSGQADHQNGQKNHSKDLSYAGSRHSNNGLKLLNLQTFWYEFANLLMCVTLCSMYVMWSIEKRPRDLKKQKIFTCLDFGDCRRPICIFSTASQSCSTFSNEQFRFLRHRNHNKKRRAYSTLGVEIQRKVCYQCIYYLVFTNYTRVALSKFH